MQRYASLFRQLEQQQAGAFVPFVTLGDPDLGSSLQIIDTLVANGADALELGIPFSDPLADGPVIQNAVQRALQAGTTLNHCLELLAVLRQKYPQLPIGLLMYANLIYRYGIDAFYQRCAQTGVDSVLVADVPLEESAPFYDAAIQQGIAPILICPPNADRDLLADIARFAKGYIYLVSRAGVTGVDNLPSQLPLHALVEQLKQQQTVPLLQGFGISTVKQVAEALQSGAAGVICGSAIVKIIEQYHHDKATMLKQLGDFVSQMKAATVCQMK